MKKIVPMAILSALWLCQATWAGAPVTELLKAGGKALVRKGGTQAIKQTAKSAPLQAAAKLAREAAESQTHRSARRIATHFGDDVVQAAATGAIRSASFADDAALACSRLSSQNSRRLLMLGDELSASGQASGVVGLLAKHGKADEIVDFLWRNKGTLAGTGVLATLMVNPDKALAAATSLGESVIDNTAEHIAKPLAATAGKQVAETMSSPLVETAIGLAFVLIIALVGYKVWSLVGIQKGQA